MCRRRLRLLNGRNESEEEKLIEGKRRILAFTQLIIQTHHHGKEMGGNSVTSWGVGQRQCRICLPA